MKTTLGMPRTWWGVSSPGWKYFLCIPKSCLRKKRTDWVINASQPRCRLPPYNNWVHHLPCRHSLTQVLLRSLNQNSPPKKMATSWHKMISEPILYQNRFKVNNKMIASKFKISFFTFFHWIWLYPFPVIFTLDQLKKWHIMLSFLIPILV